MNNRISFCIESCFCFYYIYSISFGYICFKSTIIVVRVIYNSKVWYCFPIFINLLFNHIINKSYT
uniref:Uncharacterized protein n=1 Tax=Siphoviridae sp. ctuUw41 TaxID=2826503 RepID=A0A8S5MXX0_9CAUD|nr:MAG TPA: hypothetical protein [Siphoviridae sp. ctuUw41]